MVADGKRVALDLPQRKNQRSSDPHSILKAQWVTRGITLDREQRVLSSKYRST